MLAATTASSEGPGVLFTPLPLLRLIVSGTIVPPGELAPITLFKAAIPPYATRTNADPTADE